MSAAPEPGQNIRVIPFAVDLPPAILGPRSLALSETGNPLPAVVGTLTWLGKSILVWFAFGNISNGQDVEEKNKIVGRSMKRSMGPLMLSMPRSKYQGAFASETPTSKLIGHENDDTELVASNMASRLSQRTQRAIFVSCDLETLASSFSNANDPDSGLLQQRVAALAEREIFRVIQEQSGKKEKSDGHT